MMDELRFVVREPGKAYVDDMLWLPKALIPLEAVKTVLQFWEPSSDGEPTLRCLWSETAHHLVCPREFVRPELYTQFNFPFIDLTPRRFKKTGLVLKHPPRDDDQVRADRALAQARGGILNLACGKGKTYLALKRIVDLGCPALIIVHNGFLMDQWVNHAIPDHIELPPGEKVGIIQGGEFDWEHPLTVAMIHTLAARVEQGKIPDGFRQHFGAGVWDEVQHLSAPFFLPTANVVSAVRLGLTATHQRVDGLDFIFKFHLGDVFYSDLVQKIIPRIYFQRTPVWFDWVNEPKVRDVTGEVHLGKFRTFMGDHQESNNFRAKCIQEALDQGRKILCVSHSKNQLQNLHEMFSGSGLIISETEQSERTRIVRQSQLTFAIANLGFEGLDDSSLDTGFVLLPFGSRNAIPNDLQQLMGRLQRDRPGRNTPVLVIFDDYKLKPLHQTCNVMRNQLRHWDKHVRGMPALKFETFTVPK